MSVGDLCEASGLHVTFGGPCSPACLCSLERGYYELPAGGWRPGQRLRFLDGHLFPGGVLRVREDGVAQPEGGVPVRILVDSGAEVPVGPADGAGRRLTRLAGPGGRLTSFTGATVQADGVGRLIVEIGTTAITPLRPLPSGGDGDDVCGVSVQYSAKKAQLEEICAIRQNEGARVAAVMGVGCTSGAGEGQAR